MGTPVSAGRLSVEASGILGFLPKTSWCDENPLFMLRVFLALHAHANATSGERFGVSLNIFSRQTSVIWWFLSHNPFIQGAIPPAVPSSILSNSPISLISSEQNSLPRSVQIRAGGPNTENQWVSTASATDDVVLRLINVATENLVYASIIWSM